MVVQVEYNSSQNFKIIHGALFEIFHEKVYVVFYLETKLKFYIWSTLTQSLSIDMGIDICIGIRYYRYRYSIIFSAIQISYMSNLEGLIASQTIEAHPRGGSYFYQNQLDFLHVFNV